MSLIDTYQLATCGQNFYDTFTMASNGILIRIRIEPYPPIGPVIPPGAIGGYLPNGTGLSLRKKHRNKYRDDNKEEEEEVELKRITVTATINKIDYVETIIVENTPSLTVKNVKVDVNTSGDKPKITITIKK